ncbi:MAG: NADH-quinone oxidoreductase subunit J, partial [Alphaproteobacteria bacterium]
GGLIGLVLLIELVFVAASGSLRLDPTSIESSGLTNTQAIGMELYTTYFYAVQVGGLVLLVAMIGAIVLTMRTRAGVKRQDIPSQIDRKPSDSVVMKKVQSGQGI